MVEAGGRTVVVGVSGSGIADHHGSLPGYLLAEEPLRVVGQA